MANLSDLGRLTGRLSIVEMSKEILLAHFMAIRLSRRTSKKPIAEPKVSASKKELQPRKTPSMDVLMASMSPEQIKELLSKLGG